MIDRRDVAPEPPEIAITAVRTTRQGPRPDPWRAERRSEQPLTYRVVYLVDDSRAFSLASGLENPSYTADLSGLPGSRTGRLSVLATDGVRSSFAVSEPFPVSQKGPQISIHSPTAGQVVPADQPVNLNGQGPTSPVPRCPRTG